MDDVWLVPDRLFDGDRLSSGEAVLLVDGRIEGRAWARDLPEGAPRIALSGTLSPGFVDLQVNGGGGVLFNTNPSVEGLHAIAEAHRKFGTVAMLPTLITDAAEVMSKAVDAVIGAYGVCGIAGVHFEGPHIARARRGTHAAEHVRPFDEGTFDCIRRLRAADIPVMITLAPEVVGNDIVAKLAGTGAIVSLGHSDATAEEARSAFAAGARAVTHLFNAMSPLGHRAPGLVGASLASDWLVGIIADGHHVADEVVALACRARPMPDLMFAVSDAMPTVGGPDHFNLYGQQITVRNGQLVNAEGNLAGAHISLSDAVARLAGPIGLSPEDALRMGITVPAGLISREDLASLDNRCLADLVLLDEALRLFAVGAAIMEGMEAVG